MVALPFSYFLRKGYITPRLGLRLCGLFALGAGQGLIGWWMINSGLEELESEFAEPKVSPYRLAAHLTSAFAIYSGLFWTALSVVMPEPPVESVACVQGAAKVKCLAFHDWLPTHHGETIHGDTVVPRTETRECVREQTEDAKKRFPMLVFIMGVFARLRNGFERILYLDWFSRWPFWWQEKLLDRLIAEDDVNPKDTAKQSALLSQLNKHRSL
ncbi:unnamed protein product [Fraxinus pennsylvanica]|uniref:Uncharacterized protein n=1 Tax=Fraxinus pennsylvanica TaxID=56036 RepID=A0AAD1Z8A7_9LAMI|nr:unnamed protein product [Fraxinus pennsylvanica]